MNIAKALAAHQQGKLDDAAAFYVQILKTNPADFNAMHLLGVVHLQSGRTEHGVELIQTAVRLNPNVADAYNNLGNGLRILKRLNEALANYDQAIALNPRHADAFNNRALVLWDLSRSEETLAPTQLATARAQRKSERLKEILRGFDRAIELNAKFVEAYKNRSTLLLEL